MRGKHLQRPDWTPIDVISSLWRSGLSLRRVALNAGYDPSYLSKALRIPHHPHAESIIAGALGLEPEQIWPARWARRNARRARKGAASA